LIPVLRWTLIAILAMAGLLAASQLVIPPLVEERLEGRLTEAGGRANVSVSAFPAARLLFDDGERISVTGNGLDLALTEPGGDVFDRLDGFERVDVGLRDVHAGPFAVSSFELAKEGGSAPYRLVSRADTTPAALARYGADRLGMPGGRLLGFVTQRALGDRPIPVALDLELESEHGRVVVVDGGGTVAGYPAGPLAELITSAVVVRL
jgi:hypothetical protein